MMRVEVLPLDFLKDEQTLMSYPVEYCLSVV